MDGPIHGKQGWDLIEYDWDDATGIATGIYENVDLEQTATKTFFHPCRPEHFKQR